MNVASGTGLICVNEDEDVLPGLNLLPGGSCATDGGARFEADGGA